MKIMGNLNDSFTGVSKLLVEAVVFFVVEVIFEKEVHINHYDLQWCYG